METEIKNRILKNVKAFYRLVKIKNKFGYINNGENYFISVFKDAKGNGFYITLFKQPNKEIECRVQEIKKNIVLA